MMIQTGSVEKMTFHFKMLTDDQIEEIQSAAFDVMRTAGFRVHHSDARKMLKQAGAVVTDDRVKVPEYIVRDCIRQAPKYWTVFDREGRRAMEVSGRKSYFGTSTASPNTMDALTGEVRPTLLADIQRGALIADALEHIDFIMPFGSSQDVPGNACDIREFPAVVSHTTKPIVFISYSGRGVELVYEMAAAVAGGLERLQERPFVIAYPEPIAPMVYPSDVVDRIFAAADLRMPQIPAASVMMGATGPVTLAGAVVQGLAESLMCLTLAQLRKPGCPVSLSCNMAVMDMHSGLSSFGAPNKSTALCLHAEVARSFGLPTWGLAGATDSKRIDAQAGVEATLHIMAQALAGVNLIHDVGYMDSGMTCSPQQLILGNEIIGMVKQFLTGCTVNRETLAREVIEAVGPGGQFLTQAHTLSHFKHHNWMPRLMDRQTRAQWEQSGKGDAASRIAEQAAKILETHRPPKLDGKILDSLDEIRVRGEKELTALQA
jgi:trimethylamine--corrinoid protein Co-methyltransferase